METEKDRQMVAGGGTGREGEREKEGEGDI